MYTPGSGLRFPASQEHSRVNVHLFSGDTYQTLGRTGRWGYLEAGHRVGGEGTGAPPWPSGSHLTALCLLRTELKQKKPGPCLPELPIQQKPPQPPGAGSCPLEPLNSGASPVPVGLSRMGLRVHFDLPPHTALTWTTLCLLTGLMVPSRTSPGFPQRDRAPARLTTKPSREPPLRWRPSHTSRWLARPRRPQASDPSSGPIYFYS